MGIATIAIRNLGRNKFRTVLTLAGVIIAVIAFLLLRTILWSWTAGIEQASKDRVVTRQKVSFIMPLPLRYVEEVRQIPGVRLASGMNWFGAKDPKHEHEFFSTIAVDPETFLKVYDEVIVPSDQEQAWKQNRRGALIGDALAKKLGWKLGDKIVLQGTIYPGDWEFQISGIYTAKRATVDRSTLWFHWDYMNEAQPARLKDNVGWIAARVNDPSRASQIAKLIDQRFEERDTQTLSMDERSFQSSFLGMISAILGAVNIVSIVIMIIMMLILGNTIAMGVRERTQEYGVLRAIGFLPRHVVFFIIAEGAVLGAVGGALGLLIGYPFVEKGVGRFLEENMGAFFPFFRVNPGIAGMAFGLAVVLGLLAAIIPARQAARLEVVSALRRVG
jgi:putative ABC transport system permease protein